MLRRLVPDQSRYQALNWLSISTQKSETLIQPSQVQHNTPICCLLVIILLPRNLHLSRSNRTTGPILRRRSRLSLILLLAHILQKLLPRLNRALKELHVRIGKVT